MADTKSGSTSRTSSPGVTGNQFSPPEARSPQTAGQLGSKPKRQSKPKPASTSAPSLNKEPFALIEKFREDIQKAIGKLYTQGHVEAADVLRSLRKAIDTSLPEAKAEAEKRAEEEAYREADREVRAAA